MSKEQAIAEIQRVSKIIGQAPTVTEYHQHGYYDWHKICQCLTGQNGQWAESCRLVRLLPHTTSEGSNYKYIRSIRTTYLGNTTTMSSTYEARFVDVLNAWNEEWICHSEIKETIKYIGIDEKHHQYRPDFFLPKRNLFQ